MPKLTNRVLAHIEVTAEGDLRGVQDKIEDVLKEWNGKLLPLNKTIKPLNLNSGVQIQLSSDLLARLGKDSIEIHEDMQRIYHIYKLHSRSVEQEMFISDCDGAGGDADDVPSSSHWLLPNEQFYGMWENLIFEPGMKEDLLNFALSALTFSQHKINQHIISCNRLILLHGPPGTGKTSLCKALAQKLAIRTKKQYNHCHLIEINSHSLFSKWFSESGKLVMRLFTKIREILEDAQSLVCVLIDEIESLAYARNSMSGQEPKDAMRVVNALLTQLDNIKTHPNVLILATSNLADTIDLAFIDRADVKQFIGLPNQDAVRIIYGSMLEELMRVGIVVAQESLENGGMHEGLLQQLIERSVGLSGRTLRKLPYLAHAACELDRQREEAEPIELINFLDVLLTALKKHKQNQCEI